MKCLADFGNIAYSKRAVVSQVVFANDTHFGQTGDVSCTKNFNVVDGPRERRVLREAGYHSVVAGPSAHRARRDWSFVPPAK